MSYTNVKGTMPGPRSKEIIDMWHQYEADVTGYQAPVVWDCGTGCVVTEGAGNTFVDWTSGVLVINVGNAHPAKVNA